MKKIITALAIFASTIAFSQVGIGTTSPHSSSILDLTASDKALLIPRVANSNNIATPVNGMMIYAVNPKCFKAYQGGAWVDISPCTAITSAMTFGTVTYQGTSVINTSGIGYNGETVPSASTITVQVTVTEPTSYNFSATHAGTGLVYSASGNFTAAGTFPVVLNNNGVAIPGETFGVLTMPLTGASNSINLVPRIDIKSIPAIATEVKDVTYGSKTWMDRNLGARRVATAINDVLSYGNHYQWGRPADGHEISVWKGDDQTTGRGFYDATALEALSATTTPGHPNFILTNAGTYDWLATQADPDRWATASKGPCPVGYHVPTEADWITAVTYGAWNNKTDTFNSDLKLPSAGSRSRFSGSLTNQGTIGFYWSNTVIDPNARSLVFSSTAANTTNHNRAFGFTVRCLKD